MAPVQKAASLHEHTVVGIAEGRVGRRARRSPRPSNEPESGEVMVSQAVHPSVLSTGLSYAGGDCRRVTIDAWNRVTVDITGL